MTSQKELPFVTFILLTYNQESFIEEAVRAALEQDYPRLKIIISDDCSTDKTFELANKMVGAYKGRHAVDSSTNEVNKGLIAHLNSVMSRVDTELVVLAAGDDISLDCRVSRIVDAYISGGKPQLLWSKASTIDRSGKLLEGVVPDHETLMGKFDVIISSLDSAGGRVGLYLGATEAWSMDLWNKYGSIEYPHCYEDVVMGFRATLESCYKFIDEPLVKYRVNVGMSSTVAHSLTGKIDLRRRNLSLKRDLAKQRCDDLAISSSKYDSSVRARVSKQALAFSIRSAYYESPSKVLKFLKASPVVTITMGISEGWYLLKLSIRAWLNLLKAKSISAKFI